MTTADIIIDDREVQTALRRLAVRAYSGSETNAPEALLRDARALIAQSGGGDVFHAVRGASSLDLNGVIGVHRRGGQEYEIGYWFAARVRGQGIATEAVRAVVGALAASRPSCAIVAECHPDNERSRALLRRIGFVSTGRPGKRPGR